MSLDLFYDEENFFKIGRFFNHDIKSKNSHIKKPKLLLWTDFSLSDVDSLNDAVDNENIRNSFLKILELSSCESDSKKEIILDLFFYSFKFCKERNLTEEQISVFLSLIRNIHKFNTETSFDNCLEVYQFFYDSLLLHSVHRPPFSLEIFNTEEFKTVSEYVLDTYFRHYKMYKYAFTPEVVMDLNIEYPFIKEEDSVKNAGTPIMDFEPDDDQDESKDQDLNTDNIDEEEPDSVHLLRKFIRSFLIDEVKKVKNDVEDKLKVVKESINSKISATENENNSKNKKSARGSANKAKKK